MLAGSRLRFGAIAGMGVLAVGLAAAAVVFFAEQGRTTASANDNVQWASLPDGHIWTEDDVSFISDAEQVYRERYEDAPITYGPPPESVEQFLIEKPAGAVIGTVAESITVELPGEEEGEQGPLATFHKLDVERWLGILRAALRSLSSYRNLAASCPPIATVSRSRIPSSNQGHAISSS